MADVVLVSLAVSAISMTVTQSVLFSKIRETLNLRVLKCSYCLSHWVAFILVLAISHSAVDWIIKSFAIVTLASVFSIGISIFLERIDH